MASELLIGKLRGMCSAVPLQGKVVLIARFVCEAKPKKLRFF